MADPPGISARADGGRQVLLIACGALAREIVALVRGSRWDALSVSCLPARLHNSPHLIAGAVRERIREARGRFGRIYVAYGDCGTGGALDEVLAEEGIERIPGPHCYEFYAGPAGFAELAGSDPGTFFLTDFLVRHFERLIVGGLGLDRHPELLSDYFGNYRRLVYLAQTDDAALTAAAAAAARRLGLGFERRFTGYGGLARFVERAASAGATDAGAVRRPAA